MVVFALGLPLVGRAPFVAVCAEAGCFQAHYLVVVVGVVVVRQAALAGRGYLPAGICGWYVR